MQHGSFEYIASTPTQLTTFISGFGAEDPQVRQSRGFAKSILRGDLCYKSRVPFSSCLSVIESDFCRSWEGIKELWGRNVTLGGRSDSCATWKLHPCISSAAYFGEKAKNSIGEQPPSPSTRRALLLGLLTLWCSVLAPLVAFSSGLVGLLKLKPLAGFRACADAHGFIFKAMDVCNYLECEHMLSPCERKAPALNEIYSSKPEIN